MASNYAKRMAYLSARIFGELHRPTETKNLKVVKLFREKPNNKKEELVNYYPDHVRYTNFFSKLRHLGLYRDEHADFKEEMVRVRKARGKVKPKKGEGKRAMKRK